MLIRFLPHIPVPAKLPKLEPPLTSRAGSKHGVILERELAHQG